VLFTKEPFLKAAVSEETPNQSLQELEQLFEQHYQLVYRTAYGVTGSVEDAEDVLQTIFLRLLARTFPPDLSKDPKPYLYKAAFNLSLNTMRQRKRCVLTDNVEPFDKRFTTVQSGVENEIDRRLHEAIADLNPAAAEVVILRYVHNYSLRDIAKLLGTTRSTVAVSLFRSRARLKKLIRACWEEQR
jgi:RNA polymerase sigma-70 factor, ECF subfamily